MGMLSRINQNLLSKFKPKSLSSIFSRIFSPAVAPPHGTVINPQPQPRVPIVVSDLNRQSIFLIEHFHNGTTNFSKLSVAAAAENNSSWRDHHRRICNPFPGRPGKFKLVGSCKEWTLFWDYGEDGDEDEDVFVVDEEDGDWFYQYQRPLSLWNPTTNCIKTLPPSLLPRPRRVFSVDIDCFGFGFDPKSHDYKLVRFLQYDCKYFTVTSNSWCEVHIELYSLKTDSWKQITPPPDLTTTPCFYLHSVHINGVHYWAKDRILAFDFADEKFSRISLPDAPHLGRMYGNYFLAEFHGLLAILVPYWVPAEDLTNEEKQQLKQPFSIEIWVWNGKTWNMGPQVAIGDFPVGDRISRVMAFFQNEYVFLQGYKADELMVFNCKTGAQLGESWYPA